MGKQPSETQSRHFDDPDWIIAMALAWISLPTKENVEAAALGWGYIDDDAVRRLTRALRLAERKLVATGLFEGESFARKIDAELWAALEIIIEHRTIHPPPTPPSPTTVRLVTVRSKILGPPLPGVLFREKRYATIDGVTVHRATIMKLFPATSKQLTAKAEVQCRTFLIESMKDSPDRAPEPKPDILAFCQRRFPGLSTRAFERQWGNAIAETGAKWNQKGRRENPAP